MLWLRFTTEVLFFSSVPSLYDAVPICQERHLFSSCGYLKFELVITCPGAGPLSPLTRTTSLFGYLGTDHSLDKRSESRRGLFN